MSYFDIFSRHLKKVKRTSGDNYIALCPFHPDKNPSFSFNAEKGVFHCFACKEKGNAYQFLEKLGFSKDEIHTELGIKTKNKMKNIDELKGKYKSHKVFFYQDIRGKLLYKKHRFENPKEADLPKKTFYIEWMVNDKRLVLYNLPKLKKNTKNIFLAEGEKCVEALENINGDFTALGYNNFKREFHNSHVKEYFYFKDIYIFVDNDEVGEKKAREVIEELSGIARRIYYIQFEEKEKGYDIADFLQEGHSLKKAIDRAVLVYERQIENIDLQNLLTSDIPEIQYITSLQIPKAKLSLLAGLGDTGKTLLALYLSLELLENGKNVIFLSLEDDIDDYKRRLKKLYANNPVKQRGKICIELYQQQDITLLIEEYFKMNFDFIFIDPIGSLFEDENSNTLVQPVLRKFNFLCNKYKKNIVLLHHLNKSGMVVGKKTIYDLDKIELQGAIRGASSITNNSRHIIFLRRKKDNKDVLEALTIKNNFGHKPDFEIENLLNFYSHTNQVEIRQINKEIGKIEEQIEEEGLPF